MHTFTCTHSLPQRMFIFSQGKGVLAAGVGEVVKSAFLASLPFPFGGFNLPRRKLSMFTYLKGWVKLGNRILHIKLGKLLPMDLRAQVLTFPTWELAGWG